MLNEWEEDTQTFPLLGSEPRCIVRLGLYFTHLTQSVSTNSYTLFQISDYLTVRPTIRISRRNTLGTAIRSCVLRGFALVEMYARFSSHIQADKIGREYKQTIKWLLVYSTVLTFISILIKPIFTLNNALSPLLAFWMCASPTACSWYAL